MSCVPVRHESLQPNKNRVSVDTRFVPHQSTEIFSKRLFFRNVSQQGAKRKLPILCDCCQLPTAQGPCAVNCCDLRRYKPLTFIHTSQLKQQHLDPSNGTLDPHPRGTDPTSPSNCASFARRLHSNGTLQLTTSNDTCLRHTV